MKFLGTLWTQHCNDLSERSGVKVSLQIQALLVGKQFMQDPKFKATDSGQLKIKEEQTGLTSFSLDTVPVTFG